MLPDELREATARLADSLQVLVLSVESRGGGPHHVAPPQHTALSRLLVMAAEMKALLLALREPPDGSDGST